MSNGLPMTKVFNGKRYHFMGRFSKSDAKRKASQLRQEGSRARISDVTKDWGGFNALGRKWAVWARG
jgi:hypothetical protein